MSAVDVLSLRQTVGPDASFYSVSMPRRPTCSLFGNGVHVQPQLLDHVLSFTGLCWSSRDKSFDVWHVFDMTRCRITYFHFFLSFFFPNDCTTLHIRVKKRKDEGMGRGSFCQRPSLTSATFNTHPLLFFFKQQNREETRRNQRRMFWWLPMLLAGCLSVALSALHCFSLSSQQYESRFLFLFLLRLLYVTLWFLNEI